jgi:hypothetical protein
MGTIRLYMQNQALRALAEASLLPYDIVLHKRIKRLDERVSARFEPCQDRNWQTLPDETAGEY